MDQEILIQFRKLRTVQREQLYDQLYPKYVDDRKKEIGELTIIVDIKLQEHQDAQYICNQGSWFPWKQVEIAKKSRDLYSIYKSLHNELESKTRHFEATCELNTKLKEFDIETERMVLSHMCEIELICGNKMLQSGN